MTQTTTPRPPEPDNHPPLEELDRSQRGEALAELNSVPAHRVLVVALDIGKDVHVLHLRRGDGPILLTPTKLDALKTGCQTLTDHLDQALGGGAYDLIILGHEPTGIYHEALMAHLLTRYHPHLQAQQPGAPRLRYRLLNPSLVRQERARHTGRPRKSDGIDAQAIARLLLQGCGHPVPLLTEAEQQLRCLLQTLRRLTKQRQRLHRDLSHLLERLWPGALGQTRGYATQHPELPPLVHLVDSRPLERQLVQRLLRSQPNPYDVRALDAAGVRALFTAHGERCGLATAQHILRVAHQGLLPPRPIAAVLARHAQFLFHLIEQLEAQLALCQAEAEALLPTTKGAVLTSYPGISPRLAIQYLAALGSPDRFSSARQIWAFAGFDPALSQSGNSTMRSRITQRGSPALRATLFQMGHCAAQHCPDAIRLAALVRGKGHTKVQAIIHVANALNRVLFRMLTTQQPYTSPLSAAEQERWQAVARQKRQRRPTPEASAR